MANLYEIMKDKICSTCGGNWWGLLDHQTVYCRKCNPDKKPQILGGLTVY